jgi:hypothetical protein
LTSYPSAGDPTFTVPAVTGVASINGSTVTLVLVNVCPPGSASTPSPCGSPAIPLTVNLGSGRPLTTGSASAVAGAPYDNNTDSSPSTVTKQPVAVAVDGSSATLTVPPFSVTTVTLGV